MESMSILRNNMKGIAKLLKYEDYDWWTMVVGDEGVGKSTFNIKYNNDWAKITKTKFNVKAITLTIDEFLRGMINGKKSHAITLDEGAALFTRDTMKRENKETVKKITQIRYRNLFVTICVPDPFIVDRYVRINRIKTLIRIPTRGVFEYYSKVKVAQIKQDPVTKKTIYPKPNFVGTFDAINPNDKQLKALWKEYQRKKNSYISADHSEKIWKAKQKIMDKMKNTYTLSQLCTLMEGFGRRTAKSTIRDWIELGIIPKKEVFTDIYGQIRVTEKGYKKGIENKLKLENKKNNNKNDLGNRKLALKFGKLR